MTKPSWLVVRLICWSVILHLLFHGDTMGTALEVVSTIMLVLSVVRFVLSVFNILVAVLPTFSVVFLSVVVVFGDVTEAGNQRKCHQNK